MSKSKKPARARATKAAAKDPKPEAPPPDVSEEDPRSAHSRPPHAGDPEPQVDKKLGKFDAYAPCIYCGEHYSRSAPVGADISRGSAYPAFVDHVRRAHPGLPVPSRD